MAACKWIIGCSHGCSTTMFDIGVQERGFKVYLTVNGWKALFHAIIGLNKKKKKRNTAALHIVLFYNILPFCVYSSYTVECVSMVREFSIILQSCLSYREWSNLWL